MVISMRLSPEGFIPCYVDSLQILPASWEPQQGRLLFTNERTICCPLAVCAMMPSPGNSNGLSLYMGRMATDVVDRILAP